MYKAFDSFFSSFFNGKISMGLQAFGLDAVQTFSNTKACADFNTNNKSEA